MSLVIHILIALSSVALTTYTYFAPSRFKLHLSYTLIGLTLATGTYLVFLNPAHLVSACTSGIFYLSVVSAGSLLARRKLQDATDTF